MRDGRIAWVGAFDDPGAPRWPVTDLGSGVLLPGLVNAHCHLELSHLRGVVATRGGFVGWVDGLVAERDGRPADVVRKCIREAILELGATGTVAVGDVSNRLAHLDLIEEAGLAAVVFYELLGWDPARQDAILAEADQRLLAERNRRRAGIEVRLAAHAPHSVSPALLEGIVSRGGPAAIHLAESASEVRFLADGGGDWLAFLQSRGLGHVRATPPGVGPVRYLFDRGALRPDLVAAHCVQTGPDDWELLARQRVSVAVCPRSNQALGLGLPPVERLRAAGVRLCLGTDSLASVGSLDLAADMAALHAALPQLEPFVIVEMATAAGAEALGLSDLGALEAGKRAALAFAPAAAVPDDPLPFLVSGEARLERVA